MHLHSKKLDLIGCSAGAQGSGRAGGAQIEPNTGAQAELDRIQARKKLIALAKDMK